VFARRSPFTSRTCPAKGYCIAPWRAGE